MKKNICVFCSSSSAVENVYFDAAAEAGKKITENNDILLFGGANVGLMRKLALVVKENIIVFGNFFSCLCRSIKINIFDCTA